MEKPYVVKEIEKHYDVVTNIGFTGELEGNIL
ncbi:chemotaxis protein CheY, partial [Petrotoga halophila DSM 16923]